MTSTGRRAKCLALRPQRPTKPLSERCSAAYNEPRHRRRRNGSYHHMQAFRPLAAPDEGFRLGRWCAPKTTVNGRQQSGCSILTANVRNVGASRRRSST
jgi:hypothetical protein